MNPGAKKVASARTKKLSILVISQAIGPIGLNVVAECGLPSGRRWCEADVANEERTMDVTGGLIMLVVVGWGLGFLVILILCRISGNQDRAARHAEKKLFPHSDVTITRFGNG